MEQLPLSPTPLNNTSGIETNHYGLYGSIATPYGNVSQGSNYYLKVTKGTDVGSRANAWFDWNRDGVFGTTAYPAVGWEYLGATTAGNGAYAYPVFTVPAQPLQGLPLCGW
ncbi:MAG: hypothetical protein IPP77_05165 [Bacteroidetes bacterium]|nr:hypothetical protein [Bacteroidota bacterium]